MENLKHRTILLMAYSAGLRVGEVVKLRIEDVDSKRKLLHLHGAKGRKDRYTLLSDVALESLREYFRSYKPKKYLFEGGDGRDLRYIQELLGHRSSKTTEIYTHVSRKSLEKIINPLDAAMNRKEE